MNITKEAVNDLNAIIHINLKEEDYIDQVNTELANYRKKATMPGFRPGKVPMGIIKKMYGKSVLADEVNKKVSEGLNNYIVENKLDILGFPIPNSEKNVTIDFDNQKEFDFYFDIGLAPDFTFELNEETEVPYYKIKITAKEINKALNDLKVRFAAEEQLEKTEEITDAVQGTFREMNDDGQIVDGGIVNDAFIRLEDIKLKTIQNKFLGLSKGDKVVFNPLKAIKDEQKVKSLLNLHEGPEEKLKANYEFEVKSILRIKEAELNEDLFKKVYPDKEVKDEKEFKKLLKEDLAKQYERETDRQFLADTINKVIEINNLELPDAFMKRWLMENNQGKISREQLDKQYDSYAKTFRWQLIEAKLHDQFGDEILVKEAEIREKVRAYFNTMGDMGSNPQIEAIVDSVLQNEEEKQRIYNDLLDEKFIKIFKKHVTIQEKEVDSEQFFKIASNTK